MRPSMQYRAETVGKASHTKRADMKKAPEFQGLAASYEGIQNSKLGDEGFEPPTSTV